MHLTSIIVASLATVSAVLPGVNARGDFSHSCSNYYIDSNHYLRATCDNGQGIQITSALDLNACIGIGSGANLDCVPNGNYAALGGCAGCAIRTGAYMMCGCSDMVRIGDLDACVRNTNGLLTCSF